MMVIYKYILNKERGLEIVWRLMYIIDLVLFSQKRNLAAVRATCVFSCLKESGVTKSVYETIWKRSGFDTVIALIMCW